MTKHNIYLSYFNPMIENILVNTQLEINRITEDFESWLIENEFLVLKESDTSHNWYNNQKTHIINNINVGIKNMKEFIKQQTEKHSDRLVKYQEFVMNLEKYPVKPQSIPESCTNYKLALQRIDESLTKNLNGIDLNRIDSEESDQSNGWLKHYLISTYTTGNFLQVAKNYYYGLDKNPIKLTPHIMAEVLKNGFQFCNLISNRMNTYETEAKEIINFINRDPNTNQIDQGTISDLQKIEMATKKNAMTDKAGTNPYKNIGQQPVQPMNANTDYSIFNFEYFKDILSEEEIQQQPLQQNIQQQQQVSNQQQQDMNNKEQQSFQKKNPNGTPVDSGSLAYRKKQIMCEIIKDCFNAKLSAVGLLYRDFMYLMAQHVGSYNYKKKPPN